MNGTTKLVFGIFAGFFALILLFTVVGGGMLVTGPMMYGFDGGPGRMMGGFGPWWILLPILFWGGLLALIGWAVARIFPKSRSGSDEPRQDNAEEVLRERFARGEVDAGEYERSLQVLRGDAHDSAHGDPRRTKESNLN